MNKTIFKAKETDVFAWCTTPTSNHLIQFDPTINQRRYFLYLGFGPKNAENIISMDVELTDWHNASVNSVPKWKKWIRSIAIADNNPPPVFSKFTPRQYLLNFSLTEGI